MSDSSNTEKKGLLSGLSSLFKQQQEQSEASMFGEHPLQAQIDAFRASSVGVASFRELKEHLMATSGSAGMVNLCGANLQGFRSVCGEDWDDVVLEGADVSYGSVELEQGKELEMINMNAAYADIISPDGATLKAERSCLVGARLRGAKVGEGAVFGHLELNDSDARAMDVSGARVYQVQARGADLSGANFSGATLTGDLSSWG